MKKTLLLCFIHGFKGGEDTFGEKSEFSQHLAALLGAALPRVEVRAITYPKYETRGDLFECVNRFRDWLLEKVIDIEVANGTPSPTVDPSVRTILVGHSMGGIVAAETVIALASETPIGNDEDDHDHENDDRRPGKAASSLNSLIFPYIQGVIAFDTPYLGIAPGVVAHGAESHYNKAAAALTQLGSLSGMFFGAGASKDQQQQQRGAEPKTQAKALPAPEAGHEQQSQKPNEPKSGGGGGWASWGKIAMYAGAAGAGAASGAAAYASRQHIAEGWSWVGSHLEFVGCLARGEELRSRVASMVRLNRELGVGFANLYTRLGRGTAPKEVSMVGTVMGNQRTFCNLPKKQAAGVWKEAVNDKASDETTAHMTMFEPKENPGYTQLSVDAKNLIVEWSRNEWYELSSEELGDKDTELLI
ncbi:hypothetical protein DL763_009765 [Monosporascus cannonballus]|nr:hypothetical protein DL763_009765 [Monosporascus cannonballus]